MSTSGAHRSTLHSPTANAGFRETVEHAIRLKRKADQLLDQARRACDTAAALSPQVPLEQLEVAHRALQIAEVPNRGVVFRRLNRRRWGKAA